MHVSIRAAFINDRVMLRPGELVDGYRRGWLRDADVVALALAASSAGAALPPAAEELALLLATDLERVGDLVEQLAGQLPGEPDPGAVWTFLALAWLYEHRDRYTEPLAVLELLYDDLDHPPEMDPFIRFMPGKPVGDAGLLRRWAEHCAAEGERYRHRDGRQ
ncbi:hypothetical protein GCM10010532_018560 [Dactylosporangium siamense]|uniref:DUF2247 family protein n=1 Tax=Dactylosporangium siamense TaxID=685454 RepID=A0A919PR09_9ACTN|nr:hypothetical protein Dsi01nite_066100 [Dactylosporangium siamense]